jgi:acetyl-CoA carboxylase carboxyltransferase component
MATVVPLRAGVAGVVGVRRDDLAGRAVVVCEVESDHRRGALAEADGASIAHAADRALAERVPLVIVLASSGADLEGGIGALHGWGLAARAVVRCSGVVPVLAAVTGPAVSGPALLLGLADQVVMTQDAYAFVSGPHMVQAFTGVPVTNLGLGGPGAHGRVTGVASLLVESVDDAWAALSDLVALLPAHADELPPRFHTDDPAARATPEAGEVLPASPTGSYDVRDVVRAIVDDGELLELRASHAANLVTALATLDGRPIGVVASQPMTIAGTLDIPASQKGARFVDFCDAFNLPLVTFIDTPGFSPGKDLEWRGMIRHGAQLAFAYARARVPRVSITLRKSYGGAYIVMDSKTMGCDLALAWPTAEIAVMGARGAVEILHRRIDDPAERRQLEHDYEDRLLNPYLAAERGLIDAVVEPAATRCELAIALAALDSKRQIPSRRCHDNMPL